MWLNQYKMQRLEEYINFQIIDLLRFTNGPEPTVLQMTTVQLVMNVKTEQDNIPKLCNKLYKYPQKIRRRVIRYCS